MDRKIIDLPCELFGAITRDWMIDVRGRSAGEAVNGSGQVVYGAQPRWTATLEIPLIKRDRIMVWRALMAQMRGRVNLMRLCLCDPFGVSTRAAFGLPAGAALTVPYSDDTPHSDDTEYAHQPVVYALTPLYAGVETIAYDPALINNQLAAGHYISIDDWLYQVTGIEPFSGYSVMFIEPPLRRFHGISSTIHVKARAIMAFVSDQEGRAALGSGGTFGDTTLNLVEWVDR